MFLYIFVIIYFGNNCRGFNEQKIIYLKLLLLDCDILFLQKHWLLENDKVKLEQSFKDCNVYYTYGGCAIIMHKHLKGIFQVIDTQCNRICVVMYHVNDISIVCIYMLCDLFANSLDYIYVISSIEALLAKYSLDYFVGPPG